MKLSKSQAAKVTKALDNHERLSKSYFWTRNGNAASRRAQEKKLNFSVSFKHDGVRYEYVSEVAVSCNNFYYAGSFFADGVKKNVRLFKGLMK